MDLLPALLLFAAGTGILLIFSDLFVKSAVSFSGLLRLSPLIIGFTVVAVGTSLPEMAISLTSALEGDPGLAMGNLIGSNITNLLLVFPLASLLGKIRIGTTKTPRTAVIMLITTLVFTHLYLIRLSPSLSLILILGTVIFSFLEFRWGHYGATHEDQKYLSYKKRPSPSKTLFLGLVSLAGIFSGSLLLISAAHRISAISGYSTTIIGLSLVAIATSLPELLVSILSVRHNQAKLAAGNIIGSNIYNLLLIGGVMSFFSPAVTVTNKTLIIFVLSAVVFVWLVFNYRGRLIPKTVSAAMLLYFLLYLYLEMS